MSGEGSVALWENNLPLVSLDKAKVLGIHSTVDYCLSSKLRPQFCKWFNHNGLTSFPEICRDLYPLRRNLLVKEMNTA